MRSSFTPPLLLLLTLLPLLTSFLLPVSHSPYKTLPTSSSSSTTSLSMRKGGGKPRGPLRTFEVRPPMNEKLSNFPSVRVVSPPEGGGIGKDVPEGIFDLKDALVMARERAVDLILINENADPPVCKLIDYSKWRFQREKKAKELKKSAKSTEVKEIQMSYKIDVGDLAVRSRACLKFLKSGNRVKLSVMFRGREQTHVDLGFELLNKIAADPDIAEWGAMEGRAKRDGRAVTQMMSVRSERMKLETERRKAKEKADKKAVKAGKKVELVEEEEEDLTVTDKELDSLNEEAAALLEEMEGEEDGDVDVLASLGGETSDLFG